MTLQRGLFNKFNRGMVSKDAFAREDVTPIDNSCELMENFMPERLGPMSLRPGTEYLAAAGAPETTLVPFVTASDQDALLVFESPSGFFNLKVMENGAFVDRPAVTSTLQNQTFFNSLNWTDADEGAAVSTVDLGGNDQMHLTGTGFDAAKRWQTLGSFQASVPHSFQIHVAKHQCRFQLGTAGVDSGDLFDEVLAYGWHEIQVTPGVTAITITVSNVDEITCYLEQIVLVGTTVEIDIALETVFGLTQFLPGTDLEAQRNIQASHAGNRIYLTGPGIIPMIVTRWNANSYSVEHVKTLYGPYREINTDLSNLADSLGSTGSGDATMQFDKEIFNEPNDTAFMTYAQYTPFKVAYAGQEQSATGSTTAVATDAIFVTGSGGNRVFVVNIDTTGSYTLVQLQKSFDEISWVGVKDYTAGTDVVDENYDDQLTGTDVFYRLKVETVGSMTSIILTLTYEFGVTEGEGHIWEVDAANQVDVAFYTPINSSFGDTSPDWYLGEWGGKFKYPRANCFYEGRWWAAGNNKIWGSESDFYNSFDRLIEGASASIEKTIGFSSSDEVLWLAPSARLVIGTSTGELDVRSSAFGEVLTPENTNIKIGSDLGAAPVLPIVLDQEVIFVQKGGDKLIGIDFTVNSESHAITDFTLLNPDILKPQVVRMAFQRNPEPRIYCVLDDGTMAVLLRDKTEDVLGWCLFTYSGRTYQDVAILPKKNGDEVYVVVKEDATTATIERFAQPSECLGESISKHFDSHLQFTSPGTTITGLDHLNGETVGVWVDGVDDGDYTVSANQITGVTSGTNVIVGLRYTGDYISNKLTGYDEAAVLGERRRLINTGLIMRRYTPGTVTIGPSLSDLGNFPVQEDGQAAVYGDYDYFPFPYKGRSTTDPRIAIRATAPVKIMAVTYKIKDTGSKTPVQAGTA